jgi:hypothetical protein
MGDWFCDFGFKDRFQLLIGTSLNSESDIMRRSFFEHGLRFAGQKGPIMIKLK